MKLLKSVGLFFLWILIITFCGAVVGAIAYALLGPLFGFSDGAIPLAKTGAQDIGFLSLLWAPACSLVICLQKWRKRTKLK